MSMATSSDFDALVIIDKDDHILIEVIVVPRSSRDRIIGVHGGALKVGVKAPPVDGEANHALVRYLAKQWRLSVSEVTLVAGHASRRKRVSISGVTESSLRQMLRAQRPSR